MQETKLDTQGQETSDKIKNIAIGRLDTMKNISMNQKASSAVKPSTKMSNLAPLKVQNNGIVVSSHKC